MKNFRIQIRYCGYYADFNIQCNDTSQDIENSILDKLGKNEVKFESDGFTNKKGKWILIEDIHMSYVKTWELISSFLSDKYSTWLVKTKISLVFVLLT